MYYASVLHFTKVLCSGRSPRIRGTKYKGTHKEIYKGDYIYKQVCISETARGVRNWGLKGGIQMDNNVEIVGVMPCRVVSV